MSNWRDPKHVPPHHRLYFGSLHHHGNARGVRRSHPGGRILRGQEHHDRSPGPGFRRISQNVLLKRFLPKWRMSASRGAIDRPFSYEEPNMALIPDSHAGILDTKALLYLGTQNKDGSPQVSPVWFDTNGDIIEVNSAKGRLKDLNMRARFRRWSGRPSSTRKIPTNGWGCRARWWRSRKTGAEGAHRRFGEQVSGRGQLPQPPGGPGARHLPHPGRTRYSRWVRKTPCAHDYDVVDGDLKHEILAFLYSCMSGGRKPTSTNSSS